MAIDSAGDHRYPVPLIALAPFLLITFGLAWGVLALYILLPGPMTAMFGQLSGHHPFFILAVWSPAIAAFIVITCHAGLVGLRRYLSRMLLWQCHPFWYAFLLGVPLLFYAGAAVKGNLLTDSFPFTSLPALLSAIAITLILGPIEEFGWRGLALPLLQRQFAPIWAGLILGVSGAAALVIIVLNRKTMFRKAGAVTQVIPRCKDRDAGEGHWGAALFGGSAMSGPYLDELLNAVPEVDER
ncbi:MAG: hypothetical protein AAGA83_08530 [Cyanobacteria bacterium P01_F01_bin.116]